jgi:hypothetical protein
MRRACSAEAARSAPLRRRVAGEVLAGQARRGREAVIVVTPPRSPGSPAPGDGCRRARRARTSRARCAAGCGSHPAPPARDRVYGGARPAGLARSAPPGVRPQPAGRRLGEDLDANGVTASRPNPAMPRRAGLTPSVAALSVRRVPARWPRRRRRCHPRRSPSLHGDTSRRRSPRRPPCGAATHGPKPRRRRPRPAVPSTRTAASDPSRTFNSCPTRSGS